MPQTVEAINHSKAAGVPIIVAESKCDIMKTGNPDRPCFSAQSGENMEALRTAVITELRKIRLQQPEEDVDA